MLIVAAIDSAAPNAKHHGSGVTGSSVVSLATRAPDIGDAASNDQQGRSAVPPPAGQSKSTTSTAQWPGPWKATMRGRPVRALYAAWAIPGSGPLVWDLMSLVVPPYPPPRYTTDQPEVSAWLRRGDAPPNYDSFGLVTYHYLANQQATDVDLDAVCSWRTARALLRGHDPATHSDRRRASRMVHQERQLLRRLTRHSRHAETCALVIP